MSASSRIGGFGTGILLTKIIPGTILALSLGLISPLGVDVFSEINTIINRRYGVVLLGVVFYLMGEFIDYLRVIFHTVPGPIRRKYYDITEDSSFLPLSDVLKKFVITVITSPRRFVVNSRPYQKVRSTLAPRVPDSAKRFSKWISQLPNRLADRLLPDRVLSRGAETIDSIQSEFGFEVTPRINAPYETRFIRDSEARFGIKNSHSRHLYHSVLNFMDGRESRDLTILRLNSKFAANLTIVLALVFTISAVVSAAWLLNPTLTEEGAIPGTVITAYLFTFAVPVILLYIGFPFLSSIESRYVSRLITEYWVVVRTEQSQ